MTEHPNVARVRRLLKGATGDGRTGAPTGNAETAHAALIDPGIVYHGLSATGEFRRIEGAAAFAAFVQAAWAQLARHGTEIIALEPVGEDMVVVKARAHRIFRANGESADYDYVMILRLEDGRITAGTDLVGRAAQDAWRRAWAALPQSAD